MKPVSPVHFLMVYPDFVEETKNNRNVPGNYSEGLASISAVLKEAGHTVSLLHLTYMPDRQEFLSRVRQAGSDIVGFSVRTTAMPFVEAMAGWLDDELPDLYVTCGSYHPTLVPDEVLALRGVDNVCIGEGEYPLRDLCDSLRNEGRVRTDIPSMYFKLPDGTVIRNQIRPLIEDLDELPFPDLDLFDYQNLRTGRIHTAMVMVSRGCLFSCTYCGNSQFRNVYPNRKKYARFRSPENAIRLVERILEKQPDTQYLEFRDAIFNMYEDWFYEFMPLYREKIHLPFNCNLRFDLMDERMVQTLAQGGCYMIDIGLESGNSEMRSQYLHRHMKNDHMIEMTRWLRQYKITTCTYNIVGLPHETLSLALETVKLNAQMDVDRVIANIFYPYPMTKLYDIAKEGGYIDPRVDPNDKVQLRQPGFSRDDVLYISYRFLALMKKYRALYALSEERRDRKIAALDKKILSPLRPRALIWRWEAARTTFSRRLKRLLSKAAPAVYLKLRNRRIRALKK
ncbi:MAG: B12-binding domain-containing radical SAM protein [Oscillospiraceae bacterium]|jgi:radical SAM superfamily enzyme YgiQ (UPF0313 family)|nr:B12-binding domain-containing radical SAM protein [Oscillospiraceae bacterium]